MKASVIIITKNQKHLLQQSLPVLLSQNLEGGYEIIVVDSGSTDGALDYMKSLPIKVIKIRPEIFNFANAFNTGAKQAKAEFLIRLSGDVIPKRSNFLKGMIKPFSDPRVGGTYGKYTLTGRKGYTYPNFWSSERFPNKLTRYSLKPNLLKMLTNKKFSDEIGNFAGACCAVRKSIWKKRNFNESILGGEDSEYAIYMHLTGFDIVYNPEAEVTHEHKIEHLNAGFWREIAWRVVYSRELIKLFL